MDLFFFAEMAWKSALIAGAALALAYGLRSRSASDRALVLRVGVTMLLLLPFVSLWLPALEIVAFAAPEPAPSLDSLPPEVRMALLSGASAAAPEPTIWDDPTPLVLLAYAGGLAMVGSRLLAGLWTLVGWTRRAREVTCPEWLAAFDRVRWGISNAESVRLLVSDEVRSPLSWGWRRPVILIDPDTLDQPEDADAILAHEAAHVARRDWPVLMLSRLAATLFWFNPLVWKLEREIVQQAEEAADVAAAERVEPARYAETLLSWARANTMVPANSIAPSASALGRRMKAVLDRRLRERPSDSGWTALAILLCIGVAAPVAAAQLVAAAPQPPAAPAAPGAPPASAAPAAAAVPAAPGAPAAPEELIVVVPEIPNVGAHVETVLEAVLPQIPSIVAAATVAVHPAVEIDREEIEEAVREAHRAAAEVRHEVRVVRRAEIEAAMREAREATRDIPRRVRVSMAHGADGMERGAAGMLAGAQRMEQQADRLQDRDYRERAIARARARGETVTHEQLLEAAEGLREGAEGMREGAEEMREAARQMREGRHD